MSDSSFWDGDLSVDTTLLEEDIILRYGYREKHQELAFTGSGNHNRCLPLENRLVPGWAGDIRNCGLFRLSVAQRQPLIRPLW